jgi:hypothetical protein
MSAMDDWLDGTPIQEAIWKMASPEQYRKYQLAESDQTREYYRREFAFYLLDLIHDGILIAVGQQRLSDRKKVDRISYIDRRHYRDFDYIDPENLSEFAFAGDKFERIRVKFPPDWTDAESYRENHQTSETDGIVPNSTPALQEKKNKGGRPRKREVTMRALENLIAIQKIDIISSPHAKIYSEIVKYYKENGIANPPKEKTVQECVRSLRTELR